MPTYKYKCNECGNEFEEFQAISDDPITVCPACKGHTERIITGGVGFVLKGSGFYSTDYRSDSYKKGEQKDHSDIASPAKAESKTESSTKDTKKEV